MEYPPSGGSGDGAYYWHVPAAAVDVAEPLAITKGENADDRPIVALALGRSQHLDREVPDYAVTRWIVDALERQNLFPVFFAYDYIDKMLDYWKPKGILLPGGNFSMPLEMLAYNPGKAPADLKRYHAYAALLEYAVKNKLPTFGICAGMQVMGCWLGGKMMGVKFAAPQEDILHSSPQASHKITVQAGSLLHETCGTDYKANSFHKACLSPDFINGFRAIARTDDGIIEAIEPEKPWNEFAIGVQWHPERKASADESHPDFKLFEAFARAIRRA